ncbi:hypothetical protein VNI00_017142 [Paramarasmius palmivorus]|uniref:DUF6589 domain-containing protein n=1 Tax=Paramarasmius palmivorus TaxID=297713 RepID=A0AAW0B8M7_9AGAR
MFLLSINPASAWYTCVQISIFAAQLCTCQMYHKVGLLTHDDPQFPDNPPARLAASGPHAITTSDLEQFSPQKSAQTIKQHMPLTYSLVESVMNVNRDSLPLKDSQGHEQNTDKGSIGRRPIEMLVLTSVNPMIIGWNQRVTGYLLMPFGIHEFACQTPTKVKHLTSQMDGSLSISVSDQVGWRSPSEQYSGTRGEGRSWLGIIAREGGVLKQSVLKTGTAATAIKLEDCPPGAFHLQDHLDHVVKNKHSSMTTHSLFTGINWDYHHKIAAAHWLQALFNYVPCLKKAYQQRLTAYFQEDLALHRIPDSWQMKIQPLGTNAECEVETQGIKRCINDFNAQIGYIPESAEELLEWVGGDGTSYAAIPHLQKYLVATGLSNQ